MAIVLIEILARVDAGNTNLTQRTLFSSGVIFPSDDGVTVEVVRSLRVADLPLLTFVNAIDRSGARAVPRSFPCLSFGR